MNEQNKTIKLLCHIKKKEKKKKKEKIEFTN